MFLYQKYLFFGGNFFLPIYGKNSIYGKSSIWKAPEREVFHEVLSDLKRQKFSSHFFLKMAPPSEQEIASMVSSNGRRLDCHRISCPCQRLSERARFSINRAAAQEGHGRRFCHQVWLIDQIHNPKTTPLPIPISSALGFGILDSFFGVLPLIRGKKKVHTQILIMLYLQTQYDMLLTSLLTSPPPNTPKNGLAHILCQTGTIMITLSP